MGGHRAWAWRRAVQTCSFLPATGDSSAGDGLHHKQTEKEAGIVPGDEQKGEPTFDPQENAVDEAGENDVGFCTALLDGFDMSETGTLSVQLVLTHRGRVARSLASLSLSLSSISSASRQRAFGGETVDFLTHDPADGEDEREISSLLVHQTCVAPTIGTDRQ